MRHLVALALGATLFTGCVAERDYNDPSREGHNTPYDQYGYHPPKRPPRRHVPLRCKH